MQFTPISSLWFATFALAPGFFLPARAGAGTGARPPPGSRPGRPTGRRQGRPPRHRCSPPSSSWRSSPSARDRQRLLRRQLVDGGGARRRVRRLRAGPPRPRHLLRLRPVPQVRHRHGHRRRRAHRPLRRCWPSSASPPSRRTGSPSRWPRCSASGSSSSRGGLRTEPGPEATWSEVTPNLGWLLLGSVFAAALLNAGPIADDAAGRARTGSRGHPVRLRRAAGAHPTVHVPGRAGRAAPPAQPAGGPRRAGRVPGGLRRLMIVVGGVGVVGTIGASCSVRGRSSWSTTPS